MNKEKLLDINGSIKTWNNLKSIEYQSGINGLSKHNSRIAIMQLKDFENGINCSTKGIRTPASLLRLRRTYRVLSKRVGLKNNLDEVSREKLTQILIKENSEHLTRNAKVIFSWMKRVGIREDNPLEHLSAIQFSKGKPPWCYLGEEKIKMLLNALGFNHKALATLLYDSGIRPEEAWRLRVYFFQDDFKILEIPEKTSNGERVAKKNSFGRKIKLKLCSELIKEYIKINNLQSNDVLFSMTQSGFNRALRVQAIKLFGKEPTKARESPEKITAYDIRHNSACFWLKRYKTNKDLMYRFGWKSEDKVFYYTEFLDMRDTIDDEDLITREDKNRYETEAIENKKEIANLRRYIELKNKEDIEYDKKSGEAILLISQQIININKRLEKISPKDKRELLDTQRLKEDTNNLLIAMKNLDK